MGRHTSKHKYLAALVALTVMAGGVAEARDHQEIFSDDGYKVFDIIYFDANDKGNWVENIWKTLDSNENYKTFNYKFNKNIKSWMYAAGKQWAEILRKGASNIKSPGQLIVGTANVKNGFSSNKVPTNKPKNTFKNAVQGRVKLDYINFSNEAELEQHEGSEYSIITIGQGMGVELGTGNYGWSCGVIGQMPQNYGTVNLTSTMFHEIGHSLGIGCDKRKLNGEWYFASEANNLLSYTSHLLDEKGNRARAFQYIVDPTMASGEDKAKYNAQPSQYFQLTNLRAMDDESAVTAFLEGKGRAFFTGTNVTEVLDGKTFWGKDGIPINGWEGSGKDDSGNKLYSPELSHIELERSLMSHQNYNSYNTFMEAELALMQDIGYNIDRKNFYGKSIYKSGTTYKNTQGFFARNEAGTEYIQGHANTASMGVGLHIYGSRNNITQTSDGKNNGGADLLACGTGAAGIRVDGVENTVTLAGDAKIVADGQNGTGILVAYGRDHNINVEGDVSAMGVSGDAVRFDFGVGSFPEEYRGSFIRYGIASDATNYRRAFITSSDDMKLKYSWNVSLNKTMTDGSFSDPVHGDLGSKMGSLTVSGSLAGKSHAIYIANNAFVDNINIEKGAKITGDITSDWKHFDESLFGVKSADREKLQIQYGDKTHYYDEYCKDLVTNLNVNGDFSYAGNITGSDNMKLNVNTGATMTYIGTADVVGVHVAEGASLYGGNYKVNAYFESVDTDAGKMINHGTIGAVDGNSAMNIDGNLVSDGTLRGYAGGSQGNILVTGTATLGTGSTAIAVMGLPEENIAVLHADGGIIGLENVSGGSKGLLNYTLNPSSDNKDINAAAKPKESLEGANAQQMDTYKKVNDMAGDLANNPSKDNSSIKNELRAFYGLSDAKALTALDDMVTNNKEESKGAVLASQGSTWNAKILSARLATALGQSPAMMHIGVNHFAKDEDSGVDVPVKLSTEQDQSAWVKFSRNWSRTAGGSNYTGNIITMGYDWKHGENQRNGFFGSYTDSSYGHVDGSEKLKDTRFGYYTGIHRGADTQLLYADFGYLKGTRSRNAIFNSMGTVSPIKGDYKGWLVEIGGEWKHALHEIGEKTWQVSPYGAFQMSYMKQHGYTETGTSLKAYNLPGDDNFYSAIEGGVEFSRYMPKGSFNFRLGIRQALTGTGYESHETNVLGHSFIKSSRMDKTHLVTSLAVETEFDPRWQLGAELIFQKGAHDRDIMASLQLRRMW